MAAHHDALIAIMVLTSAADNDMTDKELKKMGDVVGNWPVFENFSVADLPATATRISDALGQQDGLEALFDEMQDALSPQLRETAYALACEMAATDGVLTDEEMQILELVRHRLGIDRLIAAGIERGVRARFAVA